MHEQREDGGMEAKDGLQRNDVQMDVGESVSPWQPIANDPTPRKGWRDERMDG